MAEDPIEIGNIQNVSGEISISGGNIYTGYTSEQVTTLIQQIQSTFQPRPFDGRCPYKGLDVFEEQDAELFFGRERLTGELVKRVEESGSLFVIGPAGSGTSSLVRAGLIHALKQGAIPNLHSERWLYATMKPGRDPMSELAFVLSRSMGGVQAGEEILSKGLNDATVLSRLCEQALAEEPNGRVVLFVDQFQEVFTQAGREEVRTAFLNLLTDAAQGGRFILLAAMRSDFVSSFAGYSELNALLNQHAVMVGAMQPEELVSAIAQPALRVHLQIDPDLVSQIINDMRGEPGALPLMQFALKDLFDSQQEKGGVFALTRESYLQRGGIHKALERHANNSFERLSSDEQRLARSIFGGLIEIGRGTQDTRRTALFEELIPAQTDPKDVEVLIQKLADARLVITDEQAGNDTVTISHERLIDSWPWLKKLVNEDRAVIALLNRIAADSLEWEQNGRDPSYLYTGTRLATTLQQTEVRKHSMSVLMQEFIEASQTWQKRFSVQGFLQALFFSQNREKQIEQEYARKLKALEAKYAEQQVQASARQGRTALPRQEVAYKKYALIIGNNVYDDPHLAQLKSPEQDVMALVDILKQPGLGGFEDVQAVVNRSSSEIEEKVADFCLDRARDDLMLVYFSGHGILDTQGRLYLAAKNTRSDRPSGRAISSQFITENMDASRSRRQILILDCCHSGAFHRGTKGSLGKKAVTEATFEGKGYGRVVLTATDATQYAWENDQMIGEASNSVFTHFLIEGLKSGAADLDGDGWISIDELYEYVYQQIARNSPKQTPGRWIYRQEGKFYIASSPTIA